MATDDTRLSLTGRLWRWPERADFAAPAQAGVPPWVRSLLDKRGVVGDEALRRYLTPTLASLDEPSSMADMDLAVEVLARAVRERRAITVYGDYDVDGVCSTALLIELLHSVGGEARYYIPDRRGEGYGLNAAAVRELCKDSAVLVTTDCGVTAVEEVALARSLGCEVVIVDHHRVGEALPPANACLDPQREDCKFPFKGLCATGVAFMLAVALRRRLRDEGLFATRPEPDLRRALDLVALATVADMVPLVGLNRTLVSAGLKAMSGTRRPGLLALMESARVGATVTARDLGFGLGPRINARGRLSHAGEAVELLLTADHGRARTLAAALDAANRERRDLERATVAAARQRLGESGFDAGIVVYDPAWHPGVLGLVASRVASHFRRPTIVIGEGGKGSGRSAVGCDLHAAIVSARSHLVRFGGHRAAAGVTIREEAVPAFRDAFVAAVRAQLGEPPYVPVLEPDFEVDPSALSFDVLGGIAMLAPFGQDNPEPVWVAPSVTVKGARVVANEHLKLSLAEIGLDAIGFGMGSLLPSLPPRIDVAFRLERDSYGGRERLQLKLEDVRAATLPD